VNKPARVYRRCRCVLPPLAARDGATAGAGRGVDPASGSCGQVLDAVISSGRAVVEVAAVHELA